MKRVLGLITLTLVLVFALASCSVIQKIFPQEYTVEFDLNGGENATGFAESVTAKNGETIALPTPTRENHDFLGWYLDGVLFTAEMAVTADITLKAEWKQNNIYTITYDTDDKIAIENGVFIKGELPTIPETPVVDGYVFFGWYLDEGLTERYFFDYAFEEDITLYAKFYDTTLDDYIVISNLDQLMAINDQPDAKYLLACNINCKGETIAPIDEFSGELEGNGYKIFNFSINENGINNGFIRTNNGVINDLSFADFTFDVLIGTADNKYYGIVAAVNNGTINNCHVIDSELKLQTTVSIASSANFAGYIGGIAGQNNGNIVDCSSKAVINVSASTLAQETRNGCGVSSNYYIGGICGYNSENATLNGCANYGKIDSLVYSAGSLYVHNYHSAASSAYTYANIGGVTGYNIGKIDSCVNTAEIESEIKQSAYYSAAYGYIGGMVGQNNGKCTNDYATGNIQQSGNSDIYVGGFTACNRGKTYNCYTTADISIKDNAIIKAVGGFAGENKLENGYEATINKCFSMGSIILVAAPENSGHFVGVTTGTEKDCYYLDSATISLSTVVDEVETTEVVEPTCTVGQAKALADILSVDFFENTLYFDRMIWFVVEGQLPSLR